MSIEKSDLPSGPLAHDGDEPLPPKKRSVLDNPESPGWLFNFDTGHPIGTPASYEQAERFKRAAASGHGFILENIHGNPTKVVVRPRT